MHELAYCDFLDICAEAISKGGKSCKLPPSTLEKLAQEKKGLLEKCETKCATCAPHLSYDIFTRDTFD